MEDLKLAREMLYLNDKKLVIVKDKEIIYTSEEKGIKPLFMACNTMKAELSGASCADRVVGKAAAMIYKELNIKALYCDIITEYGKNLLEDAGIAVTCVQTIEYVMNRDKTGMCPIETIAQTENEFDSLMIKIEEFLKKINLI